jgi:hypothetical protein
MKMKENQTPSLAIPMKKKKERKLTVVGVVRIEFQVIDVHPITYIIAKL